jgi:hypothetical protein
MKPKFSVNMLVYFVTEPTEAAIVTGIVQRDRHYTYLVSNREQGEMEVTEAMITDEKSFESN